MKRALILPLILLFVASTQAQTTGSIEGKVVELPGESPLKGAQIFIQDIQSTATTDANGYYCFPDIPPGVYTLKATLSGYRPAVQKGIRVKSGQKTTVDFKLNRSIPPAETVSAMDMSEFDRVQAPSLVKTGGIAWNNQAVCFVNRQEAPPSPPTDILPPDFNTEEYSKINETDFLEVLKNPLSTFAADVDAAAYANARRFILRNQLPLKDVIRSEEFINYFQYDYPEPEGDHPLSITLEYGDCPWNKQNRLVHVGLQGKRLKAGDVGRSNFVFLLDVSGSMRDANKLPLLKTSFKMLVDGLSEEDRVAIVVYAGAAGLVLPATPGSEKEMIKEALDKLEAGGSTAGGEGLKLAYEVAEKNFIKNGNNRVILATDGDFNIGISSTSELVRFIEEKRDLGVFLTALGFGMGNYKDHRLQELADRGNGNHAYIDNIKEARKIFVHDLKGTLFTIAKDVKIQVEFNPAHIRSYRLIGYENRRLKNEDFEDDTKDAGEMGSGHTVTALYEVVPASDGEKQSVQLKYQESRILDEALNSEEILTVAVRYKDPDGSKSKKISETLTGKPVDLKKSSENYRFAAAVAEFAQILFDSKYKGSATFEQVQELAQGAKGQDVFGYRAEFLDLVDRATLLTNQK